jgi:hypothetical protein
LLLDEWSTGTGVDVAPGPSGSSNLIFWKTNWKVGSFLSRFQLMVCDFEAAVGVPGEKDTESAPATVANHEIINNKRV